jgi:hypothetical protein
VVPHRLKRLTEFTWLTEFSVMGLPARRTRNAIVHTGVITGLSALVAAVFGMVNWEAESIVLGVYAIVVVVVAAYALRRP